MKPQNEGSHCGRNGHKEEICWQNIPIIVSKTFPFMSPLIGLETSSAFSELGGKAPHAENALFFSISIMRNMKLHDERSQCGIKSHKKKKY